MFAGLARFGQAAASAEIDGQVRVSTGAQVLIECACALNGMQESSAATAKPVRCYGSSLSDETGSDGSRLRPTFAPAVDAECGAPHVQSCL